MKRRIIWLILSALMALSLVLASCATTTEEEEEEEEGVVVEEEEEEEEEEGPSVTGNWWDKFGEPEYGGTITLRVTMINANFDTWYAGPFSGNWQQYESAFMDDWTLDREIWSFSPGYTPPQYKVGCLAESWEMPDGQTLVLHIRQGVHWQDMPPINGRELTADDFEYHFDRMLGTGSGFTEPSPYWLRFANYIEKVTATDKYTAVMKLKTPSALNLSYVTEVGASCLYIEPPETAKLYGEFTDFRYAAGTGPWMVTDFVADSSLTLDKNPTYWGYDERHPENQLPYADSLRTLVIPDTSTAMAALRTGKIDFITDISWEQAESLARTNPELQQMKSSSTGWAVNMRVDREPFTDINVRKALQMAIDRETIAQTHYGGNVDGKPAGLVSPEYTGWCTPYDEWPQELKEEYSYNPERTSQLLAEAGYPDGFKTNVIAASNADLDLLQIIKAQFLDVGVDMDIRVMDPAAFHAFGMAGQHDQMVYYQHCAPGFQPWIALDYRSRLPTNFTFNKDPVYDAMLVELDTISDPDGPERVSTEADMYALGKHWAVQVCPTVAYRIWQPYLKGYSGEAPNYMYYARFWIDQDLKKSMGH